MLLRLQSRQNQLIGLCQKTQQTVHPSHLLWATHDFVDLFPSVCPSSKQKSLSLQFLHCTVCSRVSEHPYCLPPNLLPFSITLSEMKRPELYADTGKTFKHLK